MEFKGYEKIISDERRAFLWKRFQELGWNTNFHSLASFNFLMAAADFSYGRPVLDAGAGHQRFAEFFAESLYVSIEHPEGVKHKGMQNVNYDLLSPIDKRIPLRNGSIPCIYSHSVLEHVRYPNRFFDEAFRAMTPGGKIFVHVPFTYVEHEVPYDFQRPTRFGLRRWFEDAGFEIEMIVPSSSNFYGASAFVMDAMTKDLRRCGREKEIDLYAPILKLLLDKINAATDDSPLRGPSEDVTIPIGWLAIAGKAGTLEENIYKSKEEFLRQNQLSD